MSATTFSVAPFLANSGEGEAAARSRQSSFTQPPTILLPALPPSTPPAPPPPQPLSPDPSFLQPPTQHSTASPSSPAPTSPSPTSPSPLSPPSGTRRGRPPASPRRRTFSPPPPSKSRNRSPTRGAPPKDAPKPPKRPPSPPETPPTFLTDPHRPVYQTHTTIGDEADPARALMKRRKRVTIGAVEVSKEDRRQRFYRMLHTYHIHAEEEDLQRHEVIFPPGLLTGEGDMETFLGEFTALQSSYSALLSILSSLPHLCLSLSPEGYLSAYNQDPTAFFDQTMTTLTSLPYPQWFSDASSAVRGSIASTRNAPLVNSIALAYSTRTFIREEHLMFQGKGGKSTPITLTVLPVLYGQSHTSSFDERFLIGVDGPRRASSPSAAPPSTDAAGLSAHAFAGEGAEAEAEAQRLKEREEQRAAREVARSQEIARVIVLIENKEVAYRLTQHTKRIKVALHQGRRSLRYGEDGADDGGLTRRRSLQLPQPKLDSSISSALALMQTLARQEKNSMKRLMYAEIIHQLSHSKGMESVNDDVINQIEENSGVGKDVKSWLISQITNTAQPGVEERLEDKEREREKEREKEKEREREKKAEASPPPSLPTSLSMPAQPSASTSSPSAPDAADDSKATPFDSPLQSPGRGVSTRASGTKAERTSVMAGPGGGSLSRPSVKGTPSMGPRDSVRPSIMMVGPTTEPDGPMPKAMSMAVSDAQFIDPSPEISLVKKPPPAAPRSARQSRNSETATGAASNSRPNSRGTPAAALPSGRRKTLKERKSLAEKKSIVGRASNSTDPAAKDSLTGNLQRLQAASVAASASPSPLSFAPSRSTIHLPLQTMLSDRGRMLVERPADSRVLYNHWSGPLMGVEAGQVPAASERKPSLAVPDSGEAAESSVAVKESIFAVVGCHPPEIHSNAALDVNSQTLFWSAAMRPKTVDPSLQLRHSLLHSPIYLTPTQESALATSLSHLSVWNQFNVFHVSARSQGWPLTFTFTTIITQLNLMGKFGLDAVLVSNFIREVERGYFAIPYHSSTHAADVLQHSYHMITQTHLGLALSDLDMLLLLVAAAVHDYGHPGVSNQYLTTTFSPLALQYNDKNVLESYHIASIFLLMQNKPECNLFQHMDTATYRKARKMLIDLVLATDLASHFDILAVWKRKESIIDTSKDEDKMLVMQMILKSGDLGHPSRVRHLHLTWSELVTEEFFLQGDRERKNGMNVSAMMDRSTCNIVTSQIGFISFLVMPIYSAFSSYCQTEMYAMLVKANLAMWERLNIESEEVKKAKEEEEMELRRLALEKDELDSRKMREQRERKRESAERTAAFEADMQRVSQEEKEAEESRARELAEAQQLLDEEMRRDEDVAAKKTEAASVIIDVRLRRENDDEWTLAEISDSDHDSGDDAEANADEAEEAERQRRRTNRLQANQSEREDERQKRRKEKLESRRAEVEERRKREEAEAEEGAQQRRREEEQKEAEWLHSSERVEREIDERVRRSSILMQAKIKGKGARGDADGEEEGGAQGDVGQLQPVRSPSTEGRAEEQRPRPQTPSDAASDGEAPAAATAGDATAAPIRQGTAESEAPAPLPASEAEPRRPSPVASVEELQRASFAAKMQLSIQRDRERMEAEKEKARVRMQKEKARLLSFEERKAAEEAARLEKKVRRLLRKEQAMARAKAKLDEVDSLLSFAAEEAAKSREPVSARKKSVLDSARAARKSVALREVSLLMMDKEWGVRRAAAEERRIMLNYLQFVDEEEDGEEAAEEEERRSRSRGQSRQRKGSSARASARASPQVGPVAAPLAANAEEWEDEAEVVRPLPSLKTGIHPVLEGVDEERADDDSLGAEDDLDSADSDSAQHSERSFADDQPDGAFSPALSAGDEEPDSEHRVLMREERQRRALSTAEGEEGGGVEELEVREGLRSPSRHPREQVPSLVPSAGMQRSSSEETRRPIHRKERSLSTIGDAVNSRSLRKTERPRVSFQEEKERSTPRAPPRHSPRPARLQPSSAPAPDSTAAAQLQEEGCGEELSDDSSERRQMGEEDEGKEGSAEEEAERRSGEEEEKEALSTADAVEERQRQRDKAAALRAQQRRANREEAASGGGSARLPSSARSVPSPSASPSAHPLPPLSSSPSAAASSPFPSFTSFPPLTLPQLVPASSSSSASHFASSAPLEALWPSFEAAQPSAFHSRPLLPAKLHATAVVDGMQAAAAEAKGSDWRAADDEEALAAILRRVIPRSRQAELERARRAIITKARMRG